MRIGVLGAAAIVERALIEPARLVPGAEVAAIAARDPARAAGFAARYGIPAVYAGYEELLADRSLDAVYVPLTNSQHAHWSVRALESGHHVLCEKPLAANAGQAAAMVAAAERAGKVLVEAFHWRYHPVAARMIEVARGLGELEFLQAEFSIFVAPDRARYQPGAGGGSFMDLGAYCVHMLRAITGQEPEVTEARAAENPAGVDEAMSARLRFPGGAEASVRCTRAGQTRWPDSMWVRVRGTGGELTVLNPMAPQWGHRITARLPGGARLDERIEAGTSFEYQLRDFCAAVAGEKAPLTGGADAVANMRVIDDVYRAAGLGVRR